MSYYPQLSSGAMVQLPFTASQEFRTSLNDMPGAERYAYAWRTTPLGRWNIQHSTLTDAEVLTLEAFWLAQGGNTGTFTFLDPAGNLCPYSEDFTQSAWIKTGVTVGSTVTDPFAGSNAYGVTGSGTLKTSVLPSGNASGFVLCGSVWVKSASAISFTLGFVDSTSASLASNAWVIPAGVWTRISCQVTLATANPVLLSLSVASAVSLFGAQCVPMPGLGSYVKSPGNYGLHASCRFDMPSLKLNYAGYNRAGCTVSIIETN